MKLAAKRHMSRILAVALAAGLASTPRMAAANCTWQIVPSPNVPHSANYFASVSETSPSDIWAAGAYTGNDRRGHTLTEHWNGHAWTLVASPDYPNSVDFLTGISAVSPSDAWAAGFYYDFVKVKGHTLTEHWDGHVWTVVPSPNVNSRNHLIWGVSAISPSNAWIVGQYIADPNLRPLTLAEAWDGHAWTVVPSPNASIYGNMPRAVSAASKSDAWMVGAYIGSDTNNLHTLAEHWNGHVWTVVASPNVSSLPDNLYGVSTVSPSEAWAVGYYNGADGKDHTLTEHWNGHAWKIVSSPNANGNTNHLNSVSAISPSNVWAAGYFIDAGNNNISHTLIEHWNGQVWTITPSPDANKNGGLGGISTTSSSDAWAAGSYQGTDGLGHTLVEHWKC